MDTNQNPNSLTKQQKTGFVLLLVFGVLVVGLGVLQMRNTIYSPYVRRVVKNNNVDNSFIDEQLRLQRIDTDKDGLNDFDELNYYQTSPYLPDTDSDGLGDKEELDNGDDPLCPKGDMCSLEGDLTPTTTPAITSPLAEQNDTNLMDILGVSSDPQQGLDQSFASIEQMLGSPEELRKLLISTGSITEEDLKLIDDETLMSLTQGMMINNVEEKIEEQE
jgi:hypothetical protein